MARRLQVTEYAVPFHHEIIYRKLGVRDSNAARVVTGERRRATLKEP